MSYLDDPWMDEPEYPDVGEIVDYLGEPAKVLDVYDTDSDVVPKWATEGSEDDVLIVFDAGRQKKPVSLRELAPFDAGDKERRIVPFDVDEADWVGDEEDGVYVHAAAGPDGWYVTTVVDSETGSFVDDYETDDGPYRSYAEALAAGVSAATEWYYDGDRVLRAISDPVSEATKKKLSGERFDTDLTQLMAAMLARHPAVMSRQHPSQWSDDLPTFGGEEPDCTAAVWSWDEDGLLVGTCADDLQIVARSEAPT